MNQTSMRIGDCRSAALVICAVLSAGQWRHVCAEDGFGAVAQSPVRVSAHGIASGTDTVHAVGNCDDSGPGSLGAAVANAGSGDIIGLSALTCGTIILTSGAITTDLAELTLVGPGAAALEIDGSGADRVISGGATTELTLSRLTLINGVVEVDMGAVEYGSAFVRGFER